MTIYGRVLVFAVGLSCLALAVFLVRSGVIEIPWLTAVLAGALGAIAFKATLTYDGTDRDETSLESFLQHSIANNKLVVLELKTNQVVAGYIVAMSRDPEAGWLRLLPVATGLMWEGRARFNSFAHHPPILSVDVGASIDQFVTLLHKQSVLCARHFYAADAKYADTNNSSDLDFALDSARALVAQAKLSVRGDQVFRRLAAFR